MPSSAPRPLVLTPIAKERVWGEETLLPWYAQPEVGKPVGEMWLTALECTSADGESLESLLGADFPLLIKVLFPREKLSVQVHPDDARAQAMGMPRGKTECWYVLQAEPGATVACGFREPLTLEDVGAAIADGSLEEKLRQVPVRAGDLVFVDAGTVHAIGPGMVVLETQQYSDTTYRLFDYGRPRELHVKDGLAVSRVETASGLVAPLPMDGFVRLVACDYFRVDRYELNAGHSVSLGNVGELQVLIALGEGASVGDQPLPAGQAVVLPVGCRAQQVQAQGAVQVIRVLGGAAA